MEIERSENTLTITLNETNPEWENIPGEKSLVLKGDFFRPKYVVECLRHIDLTNTTHYEFPYFKFGDEDQGLWDKVMIYIMIHSSPISIKASMSVGMVCLLGKIGIQVESRCTSLDELDSIISASLSRLNSEAEVYLLRRS